jgi:lysophospholipid acyltransferase (LPLAT)-like uncharacterized protein
MEAIGFAGKRLIDLLFATTRIESDGLSPVQSIIDGGRFIFAIWHSRILLISYVYQRHNGFVLVSQSRDGELIARVLQRQGHTPIRGSSTRGGLRALAAMIRMMRKTGRPGVVTPDGPQGPRFVVQPGVITLAKKSGFPIVPVTYSAGRMKIFSSWDRFILPYPFTTCRIVYGVPMSVPADADPPTEERCRQRLETALRYITQSADRSFGHRIAP